MTLHDVIQAEKTVSEMLEVLKSKLYNNVKAKTNPNVKKISENMFTIKASCLRNGILLPAYYDQDVQAKMIEQKLKGYKAVTDFVKAIQDMIETKKVRFNGTIDPLNDETIAVLKEFLETV